MNNYPSRHVRDVMAWASKHDCYYLGQSGKGGHAKIQLPTGEIYSTASTPSDRHATRNAIRDIAKKLGVRSDTGRRAGKFRVAKGSGFSMRAALADKSPGRARFETVSLPVITPLDHAIAETTRLRDELAARYEREPFPFVRQELRRVEQQLRALTGRSSA